MSGLFEWMAEEIAGKRVAEFSVGEGLKVRLGSRRKVWRICTQDQCKEMM